LTRTLINAIILIVEEVVGSYDTVHEMARDKVRHGKAFEGMLKRYFG